MLTGQIWENSDCFQVFASHVFVMEEQNIEWQNKEVNRHRLVFRDRSEDKEFIFFHKFTLCHPNQFVPGGFVLASEGRGKGGGGRGTFAPFAPGLCLRAYMVSLFQVWCNDFLAFTSLNVSTWNKDQ